MLSKVNKNFAAMRGLNMYMFICMNKYVFTVTNTVAEKQKVLLGMKVFKRMKTNVTSCNMLLIEFHFKILC